MRNSPTKIVLAWLLSGMVCIAAETAKELALRGNEARKKGNADEAIALLSESLKSNPDAKLAGLVHALRASIYLIREDYDKVIEDCDAALQTDPAMGMAYAVRAMAYISKGEYDKGLKDSGEAIRIDPSDATGYAARGYAYAALHNADKALENFNEAIRLDPEDGRPFAMRGLSMK